MNLNHVCILCLTLLCVTHINASENPLPVEEESSSSSEGNPYEGLITPEHESFRTGEDPVEDLYCSEVIKYFPGWFCAQEGYFGEGGNGITFIVNNGTETEYMLKVQKDRSDRGVNALLQLRSHQYIIEVINSEYIKNHLIVIIEFADFGNLKSYMRKHKEQFKNETFVLDIFDRIVQGIQHVHANNITHADIKLGNIVVDKYHDPKIIDFDLCVHNNEKKGGRGTSQYMAPEVYKAWASSKRYYNGKEDVYSLGVTLYYLLQNGYPFHASGRKNVFALMKKKNILARAGTRIDISKIFYKSLKWKSRERVSIEELRQMTSQAMRNAGLSKRLRYDETLDTMHPNLFIEEMRLFAPFNVEIKSMVMALIATAVIISAFLRGAAGLPAREISGSKVK